MFVNVGLDNLVAEWLKTRSGRIIGSIVSCLVMTAATTLVVPYGIRQWNLAVSHHVVRAAVVDTHVYYDDNERQKPRRATVRYAFTVNGQSFHFNGISGNEWASVSVERHEQASRDRTIDVAYDPTDPTNNAPLDAVQWMWAWAVGFALVPPMLMALTWAWVGRVARDEVSRRSSMRRQP